MIYIKKILGKKKKNSYTTFKMIQAPLLQEAVQDAPKLPTEVPL